MIRAAFILNGGLYLLGMSGLISDGKWLFAGLYLLAGLANLAMLIRFKEERLKNGLNFFILFLNVVVAFYTAVDYHLSGKQYVQYAWVLAGLMSVVALVIQYRKRKYASEV
ncbi:MAG: hypothetical protein R2824_25730 [Saprospiraceae bacterium]|nr:hypothetical protein [Lewinella sp.]